MRRFTCTLLAATFAGMMLLGVSDRAEAFDHLSALRSGQVVVAPATLRVPPSADADGDAGLHQAVIPILISNPVSPGEVETYDDALNRLEVPADSRLLRAYANLVPSKELTRDFLETAKQGVSSVPWIGDGNGVSLYRGTSDLDAAAMKRITDASGKGATVFMNPLVVFSPDFSRVYVIVRLNVYVWGPVNSFPLGSDTLHSGVLLRDTMPELKSNGAQGLAAGNGTGEAAVRARVAVWFANNGQRLTEAVEKATQNLVASLSASLKGHS